MPDPPPPPRRATHLRVGIAAVLIAASLWLAHDQAHRWLPPAVDLARALPGVGFGRMHRLEQAVLNGLDRLERLGAGPAPQARPVRPPPRALDPLWPPAPLTPLLDPPMDGEGAWRPAGAPCLEAVDGEAPLMVRTALRVDPERPEVHVSLVAMDLRRLSLDVIAGTADGGSGRVAPSPAVVATFNGAFQSRHGRFGLMSGGRTLLPPSPGAATVAMDAQGRVALDAWPEGEAGEVVALRQNLQLLQEGARVEPQLSLVADGRREVIGHSVTRRSGLCVRPPGTLIYVWTQRGRAEALGRAMVAAGCHRGMHLDLNAFHTYFEFVAVADGVEGWEGACTARLERRMTDSPRGRYLTTQERDFFVVTRRQAPLGDPVWRLGE